MLRLVLRLAFALSLTCFSAAPEAARGCVTVAGFTRPEIPNGKLTQGVMFKLFGTDMGLDAGGGPSGPCTLSPVTAGAQLFCRAPASAGSFTVPAWVLASVPPSISVGGLPGGTITVGLHGFGERIEAPGIGFGLIRHIDSFVKSVDYRERGV